MFDSLLRAVESAAFEGFMKEQINRLCYVRVTAWNKAYPDPEKHYYGYPRPMKHYVYLAQIMKVTRNPRLKSVFEEFHIPLFGVDWTTTTSEAWCKQNMVVDLAEDDLEEIDKKCYYVYELNPKDEMVEAFLEEMEGERK